MVTMKSMEHQREFNWVEGGGIELPCKYFVYGPNEFKVRAKTC